MRFEELKIMTNDKRFVINVIEKRLIERNVSYVKLDYEGYTEFHFLDYIYKIVFAELERDKIGKFEAINNVFKSLEKEKLDIFDINANVTDINTCLKTVGDEKSKEPKPGYKKYRKNEDRNFNKQKVNVKSKLMNNFYRRG